MDQPEVSRAKAAATVVGKWISAYLPLLFVLIGFGGAYFLLPLDTFAGKFRAVVATAVFGMLFGASEIISRYRDEPFKAVVSPYGLVYLAVNAAISIAALAMIFHFDQFFSALAASDLRATLAAGFGATIVMRSRLIVLRAADGREIPIGPDFVIKTLLGTVDK